VYYASRPSRALLTLPHVQFWQAENTWRLDGSHRRRHRRNIPCLVDASNVRTMNALKPGSELNEGNGHISPVFYGSSDPPDRECA
jgi:hypothetical protein